MEKEESRSLLFLCEKYAFKLKSKPRIPFPFYDIFIGFIAQLFNFFRYAGFRVVYGGLPNLGRDRTNVLN